MALLFIELICIIWCFFSFYEDIGFMFFMCLCIFVTMTLFECILFYSTYRFFTYTIYTEGFYKSYIFKKPLCSINKAQPIYYVTFVADEGIFSRKEYIILSNEQFDYQKKSSLRIFPWDKKTLLVSYNVKTQVAMPYDEKTKFILEIEKWHSVV